MYSSGAAIYKGLVKVEAVNDETSNSAALGGGSIPITRILFLGAQFYLAFWYCCSCNEAPR